MHFPSRINRYWASMRPGQSCPGVDRRVLGDVSLHRGFNEAGAIMPRSGWVTRVPFSGSSCRFNEAGAIMPRSGRIATAPSGAPSRLQ